MEARRAQHCEGKGLTSRGIFLLCPQAPRLPALPACSALGLRAGSGGGSQAQKQGWLWTAPGSAGCTPKEPRHASTRRPRWEGGAAGRHVLTQFPLLRSCQAL